MSGRDWLAGWSARDARPLAEAESATARAALIDTNADGRELWFGLDVRGPSGEWFPACDWDDVGDHQPAERLEPAAQFGGLEVIYAWGTGRPGQRRIVEFERRQFTVRVGRNGWWLLLATSSPGPS